MFIVNTAATTNFLITSSDTIQVTRQPWVIIWLLNWWNKSKFYRHLQKDIWKEPKCFLILKVFGFFLLFVHRNPNQANELVRAMIHDVHIMRIWANRTQSRNNLILTQRKTLMFSSIFLRKTPVGVKTSISWARGPAQTPS